MSERGCADGVRTESIQESEMDGEKGPMDMTEHGCADVRRRCGRKGMNGNGEGEREKGPVGMGERGCADVRGRRGLPGSPYNPFKKIDYANFSWCIRSVAWTMLIPYLLAWSFWSFGSFCILSDSFGLFFIVLDPLGAARMLQGCHYQCMDELKVFIYIYLFVCHV